MSAADGLLTPEASLSVGRASSAGLSRHAFEEESSKDVPDSIPESHNTTPVLKKDKGKQRAVDPISPTASETAARIVPVSPSSERPAKRLRVFVPPASPPLAGRDEDAMPDSMDMMVDDDDEASGENEDEEGFQMLGLPDFSPWVSATLPYDDHEVYIPQSVQTLIDSTYRPSYSEQSCVNFFMLACIRIMQT